MKRGPASWERRHRARRGWATAGPRAFDEPSAARAVPAGVRALRNLGAQACNRLAPTDAPLGRCMNYATSTVVAAVEATALPLGAPLKKAVIDVAKLSASIPGVLANAGRVPLPRVGSAVEVACVEAWDAIRAEVSLMAEGPPRVEASRDRLDALRTLAPLWPAGVPAWAKR